MGIADPGEAGPVCASFYPLKSPSRPTAPDSSCRGNKLAWQPGLNSVQRLTSVSAAFLIYSYTLIPAHKSLAKLRDFRFFFKSSCPASLGEKKHGKFWPPRLAFLQDNNQRARTTAPEPGPSSASTSRMCSQPPLGLDLSPGCSSQESLLSSHLSSPQSPDPMHNGPGSTDTGVEGPVRCCWEVRHHCSGLSQRP